MTQDGQTRPTENDTTEARQRVTGHNVLFVLAFGLIIAVIAGLVLYFTAGT